MLDKKQVLSMLKKGACLYTEGDTYWVEHWTRCKEVDKTIAQEILASDKINVKVKD